MITEILALDMSLGGGGQLLKVNNISTRYVLLFICSALGIYKVLTGLKFPIEYFYSILSIFFFLLIGFVVGNLYGYPLDTILTVLLQYSIWIILFFLFTYLKDSNIKRIDTILIFSGLFLAFIYLSYQVGCFLGFFRNDIFFNTFNESTEFFFRGEQYFFYKGFFYFAIAALLLNYKVLHYKLILIIFLISATSLMTVRGLLLALLISFLFQFILLKKYFYVVILSIISFISVMFAFFFIPESIESFNINRQLSDLGRYQDISDLFNSITLPSFFIGNGFGAELNGRIFIENSYLDIFYKVGIIGLSLYLFPFFILFPVKNIYFLKGELRTQCICYYSCIIFVLISSFTNPFINNTIGIFIIVYCSVAVRLCVNSFKEMNQT